jgi:glycosyltransferase involved in cell wall biosynthesis
VGGNPELIAENRGVLVAPGDELPLAEEIERLLRDPGMRVELARNARKFAETHFTLDEMRRGYQDLYSELLARKNPHSPRWSVRRCSSSPVRPLRVAIVAASPRYVGGQSVQASLLLSKWKQDPQVAMRFIPIDPAFPSILKWTQKVPFLRTVIRQPLYLYTLLRGLSDADIAHIFSASYWSFLMAPIPAFLAARLTGTKTLIHYHSGEARDHLARFRTARPILEHADCLVVPSGYLSGVFREFGLRAQVVPNIVDLSQFRFRAREPIRPYLLCTRGFHPYYRIDVVVRAFAEVKRAYPEARLSLVGEGRQEPAIRALVKQLGLNDVTFAGVASREEIAKYYEENDVFINGSSLDNMPVSILEAFAAGTPVATTAPEGMRYLVEHERTGLLSEPGDAPALAGSVIRLLRDPSLSSRIVHNAHQECRRYNWKAVRGQWMEIYNSITSSRSAGAINL